MNDIKIMSIDGDTHVNSNTPFLIIETTTIFKYLTLAYSDKNISIYKININKINDILAMFKIRPCFRPLGDIFIDKVLNVIPNNILLANTCRSNVCDKIITKPTNFITIKSLGDGYLWKAHGTKHRVKYECIGVMFSINKPNINDYAVVNKSFLTPALQLYESSAPFILPTIYGMFTINNEPLYTLNKYNFFNTVDKFQKSSWEAIRGKYVTLSESDHPWYSKLDPKVDITHQSNNKSIEMFSNVSTNSTFNILIYILIAMFIIAFIMYVIYNL